jgi:large subunit ribosomal protein L29
MELQKIRNLTPDELAHQEREAGDQMFRLRFGSKLGQADTTNQIRTLRKDVARIKTIARERELGLAVAPMKSEAKAKSKSAKTQTKTKTASAAKKSSKKAAEK